MLLARLVCVDVQSAQVKMPNIRTVMFRQKIFSFDKVFREWLTAVSTHPLKEQMLTLGHFGQL